MVWRIYAAIMEQDSILASTPVSKGAGAHDSSDRPAVSAAAAKFYISKETTLTYDSCRCVCVCA